MLRRSSAFYLHLLLLLASLGSSPIAQRPLGVPRILQGPMLGAPTPTSVRVWVRLSGPYEAQLELGTRADLSDSQKSAPKRARSQDDFTLVLSAEGLHPGTQYYYRVLVQGAPDKYLGRLAPSRAATAPASPRPIRVAFGSCARAQAVAAQSIWPAIADARPDLFLWLGDNIYGDSVDPQILAEAYRAQRGVQSAQALMRSVPQLAVWDDHDFGLNNHDRRHPAKGAALRVFSQYWANPPRHPGADPGIYFRYSYGGVDFFMLDVRYHRDPNSAPDRPGKTMLGQVQLGWLQRELRKSRAPFKVLVSGSGWTCAKGPGGDSWASFLHERGELFDYLRDAEIGGVVLLSGDTHVSDLNAIPWSARGGYDLYDLVSSPLAQHASRSWLRRDPELRIRPVYDRGPSFGWLEIEHEPRPRLRFVSYDPRGLAVAQPFVVYADELRPRVISWPDKIDPAELRLLESRGPSQPMPQRGLCAHRGASATHPENTLAAFAQAVRSGAHMIELDLRLTRDGRIVVIHDETVDRTTDGSGQVADMTFAEIRALDAGSWKDPKFVGERIPTLREVLHAMPQNIWLNLHLKGGARLGRAAARIVLDEGRRHQVLMACKGAAVPAVRAIHPRLRICCMDRSGGRRQYAERTRSQRAAFVQFTGAVDSELADLVRAVQRDGIRVNYYGVEQPEELKDLLAAGVQFPLVDDLGSMLTAARALGIRPLRPVYRAQRGPIDVREFGARGDGVHDDAPAIQRAIDQAAARGGGRVLLPATSGPYRLGKPIVISSDDISIEGEPRTLLQLADRAHRDGETLHCVEIGGSDEAPVRRVALRQLRIDANYWNQPGAYRPRGVLVRHARRVVLEDVQVDRPWVGVTFGRGCVDCRADRCSVTRWHNDGFSVSADGHSGATRHIRLIDCVAQDAMDEGDQGLPGDRDNAYEIEDGCTAVELIDCRAESTSGDGFVVRSHQALSAVATSRVRFVRCQSRSIGGAGIWVRGTSPLVTVQNITIEECEVDGSIRIDQGADRVWLAGGHATRVEIGRTSVAGAVTIRNATIDSLEARISSAPASRLELSNTRILGSRSIEAPAGRVRIR